MSLREDGTAMCSRMSLMQESYRLRGLVFWGFFFFPQEGKKLMIRPSQVLGVQVILGGALGPLLLEVTNRGHYQDIQGPKITYNYNDDKRTDCY